MRLFLSALVCVMACAQETKRPDDILALVDRARALPPEFASDLMLKLAASPRVAEKQWKRELIEEAFLSGAHAQLPYYQRGAPGTDERESQEAWPNDLEALTLQTRAVEAMQPLDPQRARALFEDIVYPELPFVSCQEVKTPNLEKYFSAAIRVFERGFTPRQREKEDDIAFLKQLIGRIRTPSEVTPALRMLVEVRLSPVHRTEVVAMFAAALDRITAGDRLYAAREMELVTTALPEVHETAMFLQALRSYIVRHVSGPQCSDSARGNAIRPSVEQFNNMIARMKLQGVQPISADEAKPAKDAGTYERHLFWLSARSKQVLESLRWLEHGNRNLPDNQRFWTLAERSTDEWNARAQDLLKLIEGWSQDEEPSPEDYLFMVAHTYATLAGLIPPGPARDNEMGRYLNFLETRYAETENRNLWFVHVDRMLRSAADANDPKERQWILDRMARSRNPVIAAYAQIVG
jgi:truncated hemoglobin YjbI